MLLVGWNEIKAFAQARGLSLQEVELEDRYWLAAFDGPFGMQTNLYFDSDAESVTDYEENFQADANQKLLNRDSEGYPLGKQKVTKGNRHYQMRCIQFRTAKRDEFYNEDQGGATLEDVERTFWKLVSGTLTQMTQGELSNEDWQAALDADCVETRVDWEPSYTYEIIGGVVQFLAAVEQRCPIEVIAIPDLPAIYGGTKPFVQNFDLRFTPAKGEVRADGRAVKELPYSATYHTNKLRLRVRHGAGAAKVDIQIVFEHFRD